MKYLLTVSLLLVGCTSPAPPVTRVVIQSSNPQATEVRTSPFVKEYKVGAYIDPNNPKAMHQSHTLYIEEASPTWNLSSPSASGATRGATLLPADPAVVPNRTQDELLAELNAQKKITRAVQEQSQRLLEVAQKLTPNGESAKREEVEALRRLLGQLEQRLGQVELAATNRPLTQKTNANW